MTNGSFTRRQRLERRVLLGPEFLRRAAARRSALPEERWMLLQPRPVRESFVLEVIDGTGDPALLRQVWMMRQPDEVRQRYVREILEPALTRTARTGDAA